MIQVIEDRVPYWLATLLVLFGLAIAAGATWVICDSLNSESISLRGRIGGIAVACALFIIALMALAVGAVGSRRVAIDESGNLLLITRFGIKRINVSDGDILTVRSVQGIVRSWHIVVTRAGHIEQIVCGGATEEDALSRLASLGKVLKVQGSPIQIRDRCPPSEDVP
jgi:hypothetical protein